MAEFGLYGLQDGQCRGCNGLAPGIYAVDGDIEQEVLDRRGRGGQQTMSTLDIPITKGQGAAADLIGRQQVNQRGRQADIEDAVQGAHFVERNLIGGPAVDHPFGFGQDAKCGLGIFPGLGGQATGPDDLTDIGMGPVGVAFGQCNPRPPAGYHLRPR